MDISKYSGLLFNDRYQLIEPIGQGGKSIVYKAMDTALNKIIACKILLPELIDDELNLKRFRQEAIAAKRLDHPNIGSVTDFGQWQGQPFMILEFLEGDSLAELIQDNGRLSIERALPIFMQIISGCAYAHSRSIIHRDLKPGNIVMTKNGGQCDVVKIIDFGIAKILSENTVAGTKLTKTGDVFGSPLYMSPEQCMGKPVDNRSDIYSLGVLMYEAVTGRPPLAGPNAMVTIFKHTKEMPAKFGDIGCDPKASHALEKLVFKCLAKEPNSRYQTMDDLLRSCQAL